MCFQVYTKMPKIIIALIAMLGQFGCKSKRDNQLPHSIACNCKVVKSSTAGYSFVTFRDLPNDGYTSRVYSWVTDCAEVMGVIILVTHNETVPPPESAALSFLIYNNESINKSDIPSVDYKFTTEALIISKHNDLASLDPTTLSLQSDCVDGVAALSDANSFEIRLASSIPDVTAVTPILIVRDKTK
jgi:hypothetical protein